MVFTNKKEDELIVTCKCGCGEGLHWQAGTWDDEGEEYYISLVESSWYDKQDSRLKSYIKRLWKALRGKEYHFTELILKKDDVEEFAMFLGKLTSRAAKDGESE
jgi:hypothetical protein